MITHRNAILAAITLILIFIICRPSTPESRPSGSRRSPPPRRAKPKASSPKVKAKATSKSTPTPTPKVETPKTNSVTPAAKDSPPSPLSPHVLDYFDQAFSLDEPPQHDFTGLTLQCERTKWMEEDVYLQCGGMSAGLTSIMSQVKVCLKLAIEGGTGIVLPSMPLRDSTNLKEFNFFNDEAYMVYDRWFDGEHLIKQLGKACPRMKIVHPAKLEDHSVAVKERWSIDIGSAPGYQHLQSYFWTGRPFRAFFDEQYARLNQLSLMNPDRDASKTGITVIDIASNFLLFRITDDPTGEDLRVWNDLSHLIRFTEPTRQIVNKLLARLDRPFYGVHFRVEADTIWSSLDNQLSLDLDALDRAWEKYGNSGASKPLVYLACGDQEQVEKFVSAGKERGWEVTHKWQLAESDADTLQMINSLPFDFQGAVDMGFMIKSDFFLGITGSAFSSTVGNVRDETGRYRGSSFTVPEDGNARTHLFNDLDAAHYACCL